ncbi:phage tail sheath subtilisin-like domain-containing protein [Pseudomonas aegrilactucae]|uniref:Phage tail sheath subtilisin-like domain-containing protein n=1 Tax=Pseudomonas aegrilactucae TaxID=2854028 RepID=A0A9Q3AC12_9PSED|nr:phage tail sheath subtilisin-like domain-containing protein [Pseudomonas aegrilactucae]MBV6287357.1 phage tail sheath subtilisin-like domain-containing protein [Pseudomonas aegrilactucae]
MSVSFGNIPLDIRVPLFYAEVDNSQANSGGSTLARLIVGQVNDDADSADIGRLVLVSRTSDAMAIGGAGSMLAAMHKQFRAVDAAGEIWCLPLKVTEGTAATGTVTVAGSASAPGLINLYVAGQRVRTTVSASMSAEAVATAVAASVNTATDLPVTAQAAAGAVTLKAKFLGDLGNDIRIELNRLGAVNNELTPAGLTLAVGVMGGGVGSPEMTEALAALGDEPFEFICQPWSDTATLDAWQTTMNDSGGRWAWSKQLYGHVYSAKRGTLGQLVAAGRLRNDPHMTVHGFERGLPQPVWEVAAQFAARTAVFISADPARPTQTGTMPTIAPAPAGSRFMLDERQSLLTSGIATAYYEGGLYRIQRAITTYQRNAYGQQDDSYLDSETLHQSAHVIRYLQSRITSKYGRSKLANDGTNFGAGQAIVTPLVIRGELIAAYRELERDGIVENVELFKAHLIVERDPNNPNRLNVLFPPDLVNQLRVFALLYQFRLQYPDAA